MLLEPTSYNQLLERVLMVVANKKLQIEGETNTNIFIIFKKNNKIISQPPKP